LEESTEEYTGFKALYFAAIDSNVSLIVGVPGYPITTLMELFLDKSEVTENFEPKTVALKAENSEKVHSPIYTARWLTNEKVALETALGASVSGKRALVLVKHVGMNLLSDPLITSVTHTIGAGLVVIAGDDPGVKGSQNEQDSRWYGRIAETAVYDPTDPNAAYNSLRRAYELSEETRTPVILRVTAGLEKNKGKINRLPRSLPPHPEFDRSVWKNRMMEKHQLFHSRVYPLLEAEAENTDLNRIILRSKDGIKIGSESELRPENGFENWSERGFELEFSKRRSDRIGIISSGFVSSIVERVLQKRDLDREVIHLSLSLVNPLPLGKIRKFLKNNQKVLVAEESEPFIEEQIRIAGRIYGKKTGHLPYGQVMPEDIEFALKHIDEEKVSNPAETAFLKEWEKDRTTICTNCPYLPLYHFLSTLDVRIAGDMGCSVRSAPEPLATVDVSFALGSAISVACGFEKKGIAVIGDFALAHSGILGLISAATTGCDTLILVLQNQVAAMTGGQEVPDLRKVVEAITPDVSVFDTENFSVNEGKASGTLGVEKRISCKAEKRIINSDLLDSIQTKIALPGISVIFIKGICRKHYS
jgi:indolepyruvate ferredoxin oxidoreductase alpha subunit